MTATGQDVITAKLERSYAALAADPDGYVEWAHFRALVNRYLDTYGIDTTDRRAMALDLFIQAYWLELLRHADVPEPRLTREQYVKASLLAIADTSRLDMADGCGQVIFQVIDTDRDGAISRNDFRLFLHRVLLIEAAPGAMDMFTALDTDQDDMITRDEFVGGIREHFLSEDPDAPGSLLFGHV